MNIGKNNKRKNKKSRVPPKRKFNPSRKNKIQKGKYKSNDVIPTRQASQYHKNKHSDKADQKTQDKFLPMSVRKKC